MSPSLRLHWLPPGQNTVLISSPLVTELLRLHASRGGRLHMTLHEDTLYLSPRIAGVEVTQADRTEARRLGYYGPLPIHAPQ